MKRTFSAKIHPRHPASGFTLVEMLVVIVIIGILAAIGLPSMKGFGESNRMMSANRQLLDDISYARQKAIHTRSHVAIVFMSPDVVLNNAFLTDLGTSTSTNYTDSDRALATNLFGGQYTMYALFSRHQVGDQPGQNHPSYLTKWHTLPENIFIPKEKFQKLAPNIRATYPDPLRPFNYGNFPFPRSHNPELPNLAYIEFNSRGQLVSEPRASQTGYEDAVVPLTRGSVFAVSGTNGAAMPAPADVQETPPGAWTNSYNWVRIDWLTGRARLEQAQLR